jgi:mannose-6-phosphate isomerase-like protein (cupin superfamily)
MGYHVVRAGEHSFEERPNPTGREDQPARLASDLTTGAALKESRARLWRYPAATRGRRHADQAQEEVFVVLSGTLTMLLGEPPERVDLPPTSVVAVEPMTPLQVRNEGVEELVLFIYGAPPEHAGADFLDDPGPL